MTEPQPIDVGHVVRTPSGRLAQVVRIDLQLQEATLQRLDDGQLLTLRVTWLRRCET
jgi:hypothetical protein